MDSEEIQFQVLQEIRKLNTILEEIKERMPVPATYTALMED